MESPVILNWAQSVAKFGRILRKNNLAPVKINDLDDLATLALDLAYTRHVLSAFEPVYLQIVSKWLQPGSTFDPHQVFASICLISPVYPQILSMAEHFLLTNPHVLSEPKQVLKPLYYLLTYNRDRFLSFVNPSALYSLIASAEVETRALAVLILGLYIGASEMLVDQWLEKYCPGVQKDIFMPLEFAAENAYVQNLNTQTSGEIQLQPSPLVANIGGILVPKFTLASGSCSAFVPTETSMQNIRNIGHALMMNQPILLKGISGSGKTFFVESLSEILRPDSDIVRIHLGEQTDSKALIGTYSTGSKPGTFEWKQGVLTAAVTQGKWVLIEDLDMAPTDIISTLLPLLEKRELLIPSRDESIKASHGFQLFATISTKHNSTDIIGQRLWQTIQVEAPTQQDLQEIIAASYSALESLAPQFVNVYLCIYEIFTKKNMTRPISSRDLFKWAARTARLLEHHNKNSSNSGEEISLEIYDSIFQEAVRCFTGFSDDLQFSQSIADIIGDILEIPSSKIPHLLKSVPEVVESEDSVQVGSAQLTRKAVSSMMLRLYNEKCSKFAMTSHGLRLLEQIAIATEGAEPLLLSGETGTGKTTVVQHLANMTNRKIVVINISQQMEAGDLVGGFKPLDVKMLAGTMLEEFDELFDSTFSRVKNHQFCTLLTKSLSKNSWKNVIKLWREAFKMVQNLSKSTGETPPTKKRRLDKVDMPAWREFMEKVNAFEASLDELQKSIVFKFIEGLLIKAVRRGDWVLLDEINLAPADTLEGISDLLNKPPTLTLFEKGSDEIVKAHPDFRLFACMNPATDFGKKDLPVGIRSRFTEIYVRSPDEDIDDLRFIIDKYIGRFKMSDAYIVNDVAQLFLAAKKLSGDHAIVDGAGQRPHFSIRTLSRTLAYSALIFQTYGLRRALYEGFCMCFLTLLDKASVGVLEPLIFEHILTRLGNAKSVLSSLPPKPENEDCIQFKHYWLRKGESECFDDPKYIITPSVEVNLLNLVRATATKKFPVLIQGPTSSGKTSMIKYLAGKTGHKFVRINNHEHTDIQEYLGTYVTDKNGILSFQEGILVEAVRNGYWIVLDELNLAPTDVLEALNRLLDDNREILIPETQEVVKPHRDFMLFATQNPPGVYAGRKILSRAFRNRFLELHFDDIPQDELELILKQRCEIAPSYAKKIVDVYKDLATQRQSTRVFEQKNGFATLRDLFRWANREVVGYDQLALNGYLLLCERVRSASERIIVKTSIEKIMKVKVDIDYEAMAPQEIIDQCSSIIWTKGMKRLLVLVLEAIKQREPVLLVGETGCGKTTICQVLSQLYNIPINIINAHQGTETGDLIGSQRPVRNRSDITKSLAQELSGLYPDLTLDKALKQYRVENQQIASIDELLSRSDAMFEWVDGPLVQSMKLGTYFLLDEISLADDSVLERLNSVLEPERSLLLPEKGSDDIFVVAQPEFCFFATMNPGGDYGKKELSPALRNRFTEIWVPSMEDLDDVGLIVESKLNHKHLTRVIVDFSVQFAETYGGLSSGVISLRDILNWVQFVNLSPLKPELSVFHGGCMVFIDCIGSNALGHLANSPELLKQHRAAMVEKLCDIMQARIAARFEQEYFVTPEIVIEDSKVYFGRFELDRVAMQATSPFSLQAPTTATNAMRVIRAMTINKPILLEGSPGVGKTSLISAIAEISGHKLTRINLSDQTDLSDLFGSDTPAEGSDAGEFTWRDAPFLSALQTGGWVLLDEMNLAPQQVLEGLNACLDHRGEAYIPELDRSFKRHQDFRVFAAQNPQAQGGGRKGLPKSFVNRFTVVYMDSLLVPDLELISAHLYPEIDSQTRDGLVNLIFELNSRVVNHELGMVGQPFEFNLRDTMRWFSLCATYGLGPVEFFELIVTGRFRTENDKLKCWELFGKYFDAKSSPKRFAISASNLLAGHFSIERRACLAQIQSPLNGHLQCNTQLLETAITCVQRNWPLILTGPTNAGKTCFLRYLSYLFGSQLKEFSMNADIDSTDLLGGFDQVERGQQLSFIWSTISSLIGQDLTAQDIGLLEACQNKDLEHAAQLLGDNKEISDMIKTYRATSFDVPKFKWIDGVLVRAIENGHWLVLDNANLCNPSVLDRLNSLLEVGGSLYINECSQADGEPRKVIAHPNFRLFMTVDPRYGELSRAMRNRGVETFVDSLEARATEFDRQVLGNATTSTIEELSLDSKLPVVSKLPVWSSNYYALSLFADATQKLAPDWAFLMFVTQQSNAFFESNAFPQFMAPLKTYLQRYGHGLQLNPLLPITSDQMYNVKGSVMVEELKSRLDEAVERAARVPQSGMNLVELSVLARTKSSINCLDAYSFIFTALESPKLGFDGLELLVNFASLLFEKDFDESKVPIYRDLLEPYVGKAIHYLNLHYDFTQGGGSFEKVWQKLARGFSSREQWETFEELVEYVHKFDQLAAISPCRDAMQVSAIRNSLSGALVDTMQGRAELGVIDILKQSIGSLQPSGETTSHFKDCFIRLKARSRLNYWADSDSNPALLATLCDLEFYSTNNTFDLAQDSSGVFPWLDPNNDFVNSALKGAFTLDKVPGVVYGEALHELKILNSFIDEHSHLLAANNYNGLLANISQYFGLELDEQDDMLRYAESLVSKVLPHCIFDPAIRQHVLFENYLAQKADIERDITSWQVLRGVFESDVPNEGDEILAGQLNKLQVQPPPAIYRPRKSRIQGLYSEIAAIRSMISPTFYGNLSAEQLAIWNSNIDKVVNRLSNFTEYEDLVQIFSSVLQLLKMAVNLKFKESMQAPDLLWMLNPTATTLNAEVFTDLCAKNPSIVHSHGREILRLAQNIGFDALEPLCNGVLESIYQAWTAGRLREQEAAEAAAKDFRQGDDESNIEQDFQMLFPDYEGDVPLDTAQTTDKQDLDLCNIYYRLVNKEPDTIESTLLSVSQVFASLDCGKDDARAFPAIALTLKQQYYSSMEPVKENFNFYLEPSHVESKNAIELAHTILSRIRELQEKWPEHETLIMIANSCREIAQYMAATPVARYLQKIEQIHHHLDEWQKFATKDATVLPLIERVVALIVSWRRLELKTWPSLFKQEQLNTERQTATYWYHLYENLIYNPSKYPEDVKYSEIVRVLILFISGSTYGQYSFRVRLLDAFAQHANVKIATCIRNVRAFYSQYDSMIAELIDSKEKSLTKEINEVILLASWRDVNIASLKQSAQRSHRSLYKIIRKYRDFVTKPISDILSSEAAHFAVSDIIPRSLGLEYAALYDAKSIDETLKVWENRPKHLKNLAKRTEMMMDYVQQAVDTSIPNLLDLAVSTEQEAKRLKDATPSSLTEENKQEVGALRVEKGRLLTDTLKELKQAGVGTNIKASTIEDQALLSRVLSETPHLPYSGYFYQIVELLPRLRSSAQTTESDIPHSDLKRSMAFAENLTNMLLKQRQLLAQVDEDRVQKPYAQLVYIKDNLEAKPVKLIPGFTDIARILDLTEFISRHSRNSQLNAVAQKLAELNCPIVPTEKWFEQLSQCTELLLSTENFGICESLASDFKGSIKLPQVAKETSTVAELNNMVLDTSGSILVIIQQVSSLAKEIDNIEEDGWLITCNKLLRKLMLALHSDIIGAKLSIIVDLCLTSRTHGDVQTLLGSLMPFIGVYSELLATIKSKVEINLFENTKSIYKLMRLVFTLTSSGFCSPQEQDDQEVDTSQMQSGTGLGDGEGAQSSKNEDPEDQPDLDDISQQANQDQKQKDGTEEDQEDNAHEIEGDMAGELEDYENQESDADEEQNEPEDLDDEVGDLDDLDPNNVDEKMWDDETNTKKEKETDENVNGEKGDMEANEDDNDTQPSDQKNDDKKEGDQDQDDNDDDDQDMSEGEEGAAQDDVQQGKDQLDEGVEEQEALELPEDLKLDEGDEVDQENEQDQQDPLDEEVIEQTENPENEAGDNGPEDDIKEEDFEMDASEAEQDQDQDQDGEPDGEIEEEPKLEELEDDQPQEQEPKGENGDANMDEVAENETEGLHGPEQSEQVDEQQATKTEQKSEHAGEGANQEVNQEQDAMDTGETASAAADQDMDKSQDPQHNKNSEALKQLGDALKEFYDRQKEIQEKVERDDNETQEKDAGENPQEFEHAPNAEEFDTQALGKVDQQDVKQEIDSRNAIDEPEEQANDQDVDEDIAHEDVDSAAANTNEGEGNTQSVEENSEFQLESVVKAGHAPYLDVDMDDAEYPEISRDQGDQQLTTRPISESRELWKTYEMKTHDLSLVLCEQLRLILEPSLATKLRGDYKTGKRLNMKRIIPFIASNFKKDKIWLKRTKPSKREYQILIALDDSKSMGEPTVVDLAFQSISLVCNALTQIEAGDLAVARFGQNTEIVHSFNSPFNAEAGAQMFSHFKFEQEQTDVKKLLDRSLDLFEKHQGGGDKWKLEIIISDGICEDHDYLRRLVRKAHDSHVMLVFIVLDALNHDGSILDMNQVNYTTDANGAMKLEVDRYMDQFPFEYYVIVRNIQDLPQVMSSVLRQYFQAIE